MFDANIELSMSQLFHKLNILQPAHITKRNHTNSYRAYLKEYIANKLRGSTNDCRVKLSKK
jgi:hypothetical protein